MTHEAALAPPDAALIESLLAPLADPGGRHGGAGEDLRYSPLVAEIRLAREEDDASLARGEWVRPLKRADWPRVAALCSEMLRTRSKDLQVAAWLLEAWLRLHGVAGLRAGVQLLTCLCGAYWPVLHPRIAEDGDCDARLAPLVWLNETLPLALRLHLPLLALPGMSPPRLTLDEWERLVRRHAARPGPDTRDDDDEAPAVDAVAPLEREAVLGWARQPAQRRALAALEHELRAALADWQGLDAVVDGFMAHDAPGLGRVGQSLSLLAHTCALLKGEDAPPDTAAEAAAQPETTMADEILEPVAPLQPVELPTRRAADGPLTRAKAYQQLQTIADFLMEYEPHSPVPYLVKRAIEWGQMPLPRLMRELGKREGDLERVLELLGVESA